jgi:RimJ/RimL family protein N-acetyltransferase
MQSQFLDHGYCYFAVELLTDSKFIGFIGMAYQTYDTDFTPCTDIGWRLNRGYWGNGYATEGAKRCLEFAFNDLEIKEIVAIASKINTNSEAVMTKIGMTKVKTFNHPLLLNNARLKECVLYKINNL